MILMTKKRANGDPCDPSLIPKVVQEVKTNKLI